MQDTKTKFARGRFLQFICKEKMLASDFREWQEMNSEALVNSFLSYRENYPTDPICYHEFCSIRFKHDREDARVTLN
jgi:hypothetical protein